MSTSLDEDIVIHENLDFEPECGADWCSNTATWVARLKCCGFELFACDPCKVRETMLIETSRFRRCISCRHGPLEPGAIEWEKL